MSKPRVRLSFLVVAFPGLLLVPACGVEEGSVDVERAGVSDGRNDPNHIFLPNQPFNFAGCGNVVRVEFPANKEYFTQETLPDGTVVQSVHGKLKVSLTDTVTGAHLDVTASGPGTLTFRTDGTTLFEGRGVSLIPLGAAAAAAAGLPRLFLASGHFDLLIGNGPATVLQQNGHIRDLCAELAAQ